MRADEWCRACGGEIMRDGCCRECGLPKGSRRDAMLYLGQNPGMAQTTAERQKAFKAAQKAAGLVRLEAYVTKEQRDKFRALGGDPWLRKKIDQAKVKP
jgi:hypothetical protein